MLQIYTQDDLALHPKLGASWEGFALEEVIRLYKEADDEIYFWATHSEAELDLLIFHKGKRLGFEFKYASAPKITKSMRIALIDLKLDTLYIVYPGVKNYRMTDNIFVMGLSHLTDHPEY